MITIDKITEIFCIIDEFCKNLGTDLSKSLQILLPLTRSIDTFVIVRDACPRVRLGLFFCAIILGLSIISTLLSVLYQGVFKRLFSLRRVLQSFRGASAPRILPNGGFYENLFLLSVFGNQFCRQRDDSRMP